MSVCVGRVVWVRGGALVCFGGGSCENSAHPDIIQCL